MSYSHDKFYQLLGLCNRAGGLVSGETACEKAIKTGNAKLVVISEEASVNTLNKFFEKCNSKNITYVIAGCKKTLGRAIGKSSRTVIAITDNRFSDIILEQYRNREHQYGGD